MHVPASHARHGTERSRIARWVSIPGRFQRTRRERRNLLHGRTVLGQRNQRIRARAGPVRAISIAGFNPFDAMAPGSYTGWHGSPLSARDSPAPPELRVPSVSATGRRVLVLLLGIVGFLSGCSQVATGSKLVGSYSAHHNNGFETLELRSDGTYSHRFKSLDGTEKVYSSTWSFQPYGGETKVELDNFVQYFPRSHQGGPIGTLLGVEKRWGRIRLYLSYDRGQFYAQSPHR
jgi:hypothetical protein